MRYRICSLLILTGTLLPFAQSFAAELPGFRKGPWFDEQVREQWLDHGIRVVVNAPGVFDSKKPTRLIFYATPNGNSIEQTLGADVALGAAKSSESPDSWRFAIQHVAAQIRRLREVTPDENIVLVCAEAEDLSWPAWKRRTGDGPAHIRKVVDTVPHVGPWRLGQNRLGRP